jgi:flagellar basal-body rod protein FlgF
MNSGPPSYRQILPGSFVPSPRRRAGDPVRKPTLAIGPTLADARSMSDGIYVGMAAAAARADQLDSIADNLANAETPGFKATRPSFQSFLPPGAGQMSDKVFSAVDGNGTDMSPGAVVTTDNPLDVIPDADHFFSVATGTGQPAFTRNGQLKVSPNGVLVSDGRPVLGVSGNQIIIPPGIEPEISEEGIVTAQGSAIDRIATFKLEGNILRVGPQLYAPGPGGAVAPIPEPRLSTGQLEMGNVTPLDSTVAMINAQRQFDTAMQAIQTYKRLDDRAIEVGRVR